jgi:hypothetical protein
MICGSPWIHAMGLDADAPLIPAWNGNGRAISVRMFYRLRTMQPIGKNGAHADSVEESDR